MNEGTASQGTEREAGVSQGNVRDMLLDILWRIAPEHRGLPVDDTLDLRESMGLDSMDFLRFVMGIHDRLHVTVSEVEYAQVITLAGAVRYVEARRVSPGGEGVDAKP